MSEFNITTARDEHCYNIELALDNAAIDAAEGVTNEMDNNTNKEEVVDFNINKCNINVNGHQCKRNRTSGCTMEINGEIVYMCTQHFNMYTLAIKQGRTINPPVFHHTNIKPIQEDNTMNTNIRTRDQIIEELNAAKRQMNEFREYPYTIAAIANGDAVGDRIDMLTEELKAFDIENNTNKEEKTMKTDIFTINHKDKGYVKCVKCSKELPITDPENDWSRGAYHRSVDEVRLCMTGKSDKPIETGFLAANIWTGKGGDKMQTQYFNKNLRSEAVAWCKAVNGTMKTDPKTGSIQVTWVLEKGAFHKDS